jgi:hypothetical protein
VSTHSGTTHARSRRRRLADAAVGRLLKLPPATRDYTMTRDLRIPMRDGVELLADHYAPTGPAKGTLLVRGPYGFDLMSVVFASPFASRGYHVVTGRCRGTFGSGGAFEPLQNEVDDSADTVAWLREQPWFGGRFATIGASYLGFTQGGLLMDPPPELATAVLQVALHDLSRAAYQGGAFTLDDYVGWADAVAHQEDVGIVRGQIRGAMAPRRQRPALSHLPLAEATDELCKGRTPWFRDWATHRDLADPYWSRTQLGAALDHVGVPVLLQTGWQDLFLQQSLEQYDRLHQRGLDVALTVGPWTHAQMLTSGGSTVFPEALAWLDEHLAGTGSRIRSAPVGIFVTGAGEWRDLPEWPPPAVEQALHLQEGGGLGGEPAAGGTVTFTYDPSDPTPTIGGRLLSTAVAGYRKDGALGERADVLTFTGPVLALDRQPARRSVRAAQRGRRQGDVAQRLRGLRPARPDRHRAGRPPRSRRVRTPVRRRFPHPPAGRRRLVPALGAQPGHGRGPGDEHRDGAVPADDRPDPVPRAPPGARLTGLSDGACPRRCGAPLGASCVNTRFLAGPRVAAQP